MGGSGGGFFRSKTPPTEERVRKELDSIAKTKRQEFDNKISCHVDSLLSKLNDRDNLTINSHLDTIKDALGKDIDGTVNLLFGGSVAKHTYVDGLSDIDALVLLDKSELKDLTPQEVRDYFFSRLKKRLSNTLIEKGTLAVTVKFKDSEIQLLPAVRHETGFKIADSTGKQWSFIKPNEFTKLLTKVNQETGGKVVPTIKLAKALISDLPENRRLSGYHTEAIAIEVFQQYDGPTTTKAMLTHFFNEAPKYVLRPAIDRTGQSTHIDDYLGSENSLNRKIVMDSLGRIGRRMKNADTNHSVDQWCEILGIS